MCPARRPMGLQGSGFLLLDYNNSSTHYINVALERDCLCVSVWVRAHVRCVLTGKDKQVINTGLAKPGQFIKHKQNGQKYT